MVRREGKRWDGSLAGNNFRLKRGGDAKPYSKETNRSLVPFKESMETRGRFNTREDIRTMFQTSWADGAFWNKPLLSKTSVDSYFTAERLSTTLVPGDLKPLNSITADDQSANLFGTFAVQVGADILAVDNGATYGIRKWNGTAWSAFSNNFSTTSSPRAVAYDGVNDKIVLLVESGAGLFYVGADDSAGGAILNVGALTRGANVFFHNSRLMVWDGSKLYEITDPYGTPVSTVIYDPGGGYDQLIDMVTSAAFDIFNNDSMRLAISTSEGVYIVKNQEQEGQPTAFIYRLDRTAAGDDIGTPVATLQSGLIVLDIAVHLGSILLLATDQYQAVIANNRNKGNLDTYLYHLTNDSLGSVGSFRDSAETVWKFMGSKGDLAYYGGHKSVYEYDAVRGGLHPLFSMTRNAGSDHPARIFQTTNSSGDRARMILDSNGETQFLELGDGTDTGETRFIESNYFDFNIPAEQKTITHVTLMTDGVIANETWTVELSTDDSSFATVATHTSAENNTEKQRLSTVKTGFRFRYKLSYATTGAQAAPSSVKGIVFHALQGEMVTQWVLDIDGTEFTNVENEMQRPDTVLADLLSLAGTATVVSFVDEFKSTATTHNVKVESVKLQRSQSAEIDSARVVLTEDT